MEKPAKTNKGLYQEFYAAYRGVGSNAQINEVLQKLLSSEKEEFHQAGVLICERLASSGADLSEENQKTVARYMTSKDPKKRSVALQIKLLSTKKPDASLLEAAGADSRSLTRLVVAWILVRDKTLAAPKALALLLRDDGPVVLALAVKAAGAVRKDPVYVKPLREVLLEADPKKAGGAVLEAAIGLAEIAALHDKARRRAQASLLEALDRNCPKQLASNVLIACLKGLEGYKESDGLAKFSKLMTKEYALWVRVLATLRALLYEDAIFELHNEVVSDSDLSQQPELMTNVFHAAGSYARRLKDVKAKRDCSAAASRLLKSNEFASKACRLMRVALVENLFLNPTKWHMDYLVSMLRTEREWRVRRSILAGLALIDGKYFRKAADLALDDPHPVIKQIGLAGLVALEASADKRSAYLKKLASRPTAATCEWIFRAEGLRSELVMKGGEKIRQTLEK